VVWAQTTGIRSPITAITAGPNPRLPGRVESAGEDGVWMERNFVALTIAHAPKSGRYEAIR
jgi:hypothetical protein